MSFFLFFHTVFFAIFGIFYSAYFFGICWKPDIHTCVCVFFVFVVFQRVKFQSADCFSCVFFTALKFKNIAICVFYQTEIFFTKNKKFLLFWLSVVGWQNKKIVFGFVCFVKLKFFWIFKGVFFAKLLRIWCCWNKNTETDTINETIKTENTTTDEILKIFFLFIFFSAFLVCFEFSEHWYHLFFLKKVTVIQFKYITEFIILQQKNKKIKNTVKKIKKYGTIKISTVFLLNIFKIL